LIRSVADRIVEVTAGRTRSFAGDYEYYLERTAAEVAVPERIATPRANTKREEAEARQARSRLKSAVRRIEQELETTHSEMETLGAMLADPGFYTSGDSVGDAVRDYERLQERVGELEAEWEKLTAEMA
jgi:ATP-binding cassette subfamily F protein 3